MSMTHCILSSTLLQALSCSAARLQCPKINPCWGCSTTWNMTVLLECHLYGEDPASLSLPCLFLKKKAGCRRVYPDHYIFWLRFSPLQSQETILILNSNPFHHVSKGLVFNFDQRHLLTKHSSGRFNFCCEISHLRVQISVIHVSKSNNSFWDSKEIIYSNNLAFMLTGR